MKQPRKPNPAKQAADELQHLRAVAREAHQHALARVEGEIARVLRCVADECRETPSHQHRDDLRKIAARLQHFDIRAEKGRCKDLRRLNRLVGRLTDIVDQW
ncbi:MAG: hypothetical protein HZA91_17755 [Verrucomicrobia bacterium]|nr:hypothetical protein [Verrucomicrobiota bacterium]